MVECIRCKKTEVEDKDTMCLRCVKELGEKAKEIEPEFFLATKAYHMLGNISRKKRDICFVFKEGDDYYIGHWLTGYGFVEVVFPKKTTRKAIFEKEANKFVGYYGVRGFGEKVEKKSLLGKIDYTEHKIIY